jgi:hypothetical protein
MQEKKIDNLYVYSEVDRLGKGGFSSVYLGRSLENANL